MQSFKTTWVNIPAWCTIKTELYLHQQLLKNLSFPELFISQIFMTTDVASYLAKLSLSGLFLI